MNEAAIQSVKNASSIGQQQYEIYKCERLIQGKVSILSTISQNKLPLFRAKNRVTTSKDKLKMAALEENCKLFSSLYVSEREIFFPTFYHSLHQKLSMDQHLFVLHSQKKV